MTPDNCELCLLREIIFIQRLSRSLRPGSQLRRAGLGDPGEGNRADIHHPAASNSEVFQDPYRTNACPECLTPFGLPLFAAGRRRKCVCVCVGATGLGGLTAHTVES